MHSLKQRNIQKRKMAFVVLLLSVLAIPMLGCDTSSSSNTGSTLLTPGPAATSTSLLASGPFIYTHSWYITDAPDNTFNNIGILAQRDAQEAKTSSECKQGRPAFTILDNGQLLLSGTGTWNLGAQAWTFDQIAAGARHYITTWMAAAVSCPLVLGIGLNNHVYSSCGDGCSIPLATAGVAWANMVNGLNTWVQSSHFHSFIMVWAAGDIETTWDSPEQTLPFVQSLLSHLVPPAFLINFGDIRADFRQRTAPNTKWSDANVLTVTTSPKIVVIPEMYGTDDVNIWVSFQKRYSTQVHYMGVMTECEVADTQLTQDITNQGLCNGEYNPEQAIQAMQTQLPNQTILAVTNIRFENKALAGN